MYMYTPVFVRVCACERSTQGDQKRAEIVACSCEQPGVAGLQIELRFSEETVGAL